TTPPAAADGAPVPEPVHASREDRAAASVTVGVLQAGFSHHATPRGLLVPGRRAAVVARVCEALAPVQGGLPLGSPEHRRALVTRVGEELAIRTIDIPRITVVPTGEVRNGFHDFDLEVSQLNLQSVDNEILIQHLSTHDRET